MSHGRAIANSVKGSVRRVLRRAGYEVRPTDGPRRLGTMDASLRWLRSNAHQRPHTVLDVGASDGRWSASCMQAFPQAHYVLYEPQPAHAPDLRGFADGARTRVIHVPAAVGADTGHTWFDVSDPLGGALASEDEGTSIEVPVTTLDASVETLGLEGPFLLKLDTHGFERGILDGAASVVERACILIIEAYNYRFTAEGPFFWELCAYLHDRGFRPVDLVDVMYRERDGSLWQMDLVFLPKTWPGFDVSTYR